MLRRYVLWSELASSEEGALVVKSEETETGDELPMQSEWKTIRRKESTEG